MSCKDVGESGLLFAQLQLLIFVLICEIAMYAELCKSDPLAVLHKVDACMAS